LSAARILTSKIRLSIQNSQRDYDTIPKNKKNRSQDQRQKPFNGSFKHCDIASYNYKQTNADDDEVVP